jgi:hypothetical protein
MEVAEGEFRGCNPSFNGDLDMQWILQEFEDAFKLAAALDALGKDYTMHKAVPFVGELFPAPVVADPARVLLFGQYSLWRTAEREGWSPGVFRIAPFVEQASWKPHLLNGQGRFVALRDIPSSIEPGDELYFVRPVEDSKEMAGAVMSSDEICSMARRVLALKPKEIIQGSLCHDTLLMLCEPVVIRKEWRIWVVNGRIATWSLYKDGRRVVYRHEIEPEALHFAGEMVRLNPGYSPAYVMDICRTDDGYRIIETNCINAAGFYAADLPALVSEFEMMEARVERSGSR